MPRVIRLPVFAALLLLATAGPLMASPERAERQVQAALQLDRDAARGGKIYAQHCAGCHGPDAFGNSEALIPALAGQRRAYLIKQLADFNELEREGDAMHEAIARARLSEPQQWVDLATYLNSLPVTRFQETGAGDGVELGEAIYQEQCASCHEEDGRGDDDGFVPSLRNQHYSYLLREMRGLSGWQRHNVDADLVHFLDSLDPEELTSVADYLSRMHGPVRDRTQLDNDGTSGD